MKISADSFSYLLGTAAGTALVALLAVAAPAVVPHKPISPPQPPIRFQSLPAMPKDEMIVVYLQKSGKLSPLRLLYRFCGGAHPGFTFWTQDTKKYNVTSAFQKIGDGSLSHIQLQEMDSLLDEYRTDEHQEGSLTVLVQHRKGKHLLQQESFTEDSGSSIPTIIPIKEYGKRDR